MTLESQRRILTSMEPAQALELLLLNLASLPDLVDMETLAPAASSAPRTPSAATPPRPAPRPAPAPSPTSPAASRPAPAPSFRAESRAEAEPETEPGDDAEPDPAAPEVTGPDPAAQPDWGGFVEFLVRKNGQAESKIPGLRQLSGALEGRTLVVHCPTSYLAGRLSAPECLKALTRFTREYFGPDMSVRLDRAPEAQQRRSLDELRTEAMEDQGVRRVLESFQAKVLNVEPRRPG